MENIKCNIPFIVFIILIVFLLISAVPMIFAFSSFIDYSFNNFIQPSYLSTIIGCNMKSIEKINEELSDEGKIVRIKGAYNPDTGIEINESVDYDSTLKHEQCHEKQSQEGRLSSCLNPIGRFFSEVECYIKEKI